MIRNEVAHSARVRHTADHSIRRNPAAAAKLASRASKSDMVLVKLDKFASIFGQRLLDIVRATIR
jgi:hypothetical protein